MKNFDFTVNVEYNSNTVVSHCDSNWSNIKNNSLISIDNDGIFYTIGKIESLNLIEDFTLDNNKMVINGNYENIFMIDDTVNISYKEYELLTIKSIVNKGINYKINDVLTLSGGLLSLDIINNKSEITTFRVEEIDINGGINKLKILNKGIYIKFPEKENILSGGNGENCKISIEDKLINNRNIIERQVISADIHNGNTYIELNYKLPDNIINGKLSINKYIAKLTSNYIGKDKKNVGYSIIRDYTPEIELPLVIKGTNKMEESYNFSMIRIDKELQEIKKLIKVLQSK